MNWGCGDDWASACHGVGCGLGPGGAEGDWRRVGMARCVKMCVVEAEATAGRAGSWELVESTMAPSGATKAAEKETRGRRRRPVCISGCPHGPAHGPLGTLRLVRCPQGPDGPHHHHHYLIPRNLSCSRRSHLHVYRRRRRRRRRRHGTCLRAVQRSAAQRRRFLLRLCFSAAHAAPLERSRARALTGKVWLGRAPSRPQRHTHYRRAGGFVQRWVRCTTDRPGSTFFARLRC